MRNVNRQRPLKAAVVSLYARSNYGNCLQRRAVHELLIRSGCQPVSLYRRKLTRDSIHERLAEAASRLPFTHGTTCERARRFLIFDEPCESVCINESTFHDACEKFDLFVVGSDQVWNPRIWDFDANFNLLGFVEPSWKKVALAPSIGINILENTDVPIFKQSLSDFARLSVREEEGAEIVRGLLGRRAEVLADPTIAVGQTFWNDIADTSLRPSKPYVLVYGLGSGSKAFRLASEYASKYKYKVVVLNDPASPYYSAGPGDFVGLISESRAVFTDSFHASVFAILNHVPLMVVEREGSSCSMNSRITTLGKTFGIDMGDPLQEYDWDDVDRKVMKLRVQERRYLNDEIERVRNYII